MSKDNRPCGGVTFGDRLAYSSIPDVAYNRSDDRQAFTVTLPKGLAAGVGTPVYEGLTLTGAPVDARTYSAVVPAAGEDLNTTLVLNGFGVAEPGSGATLVLTVNGHHHVTHFGPREDRAFTVLMPFRAKAPTDLRITVAVIADRDAAHPDATALIVLNDISADARAAKK
jgi:hypothetical protein